MKNPNPTEIAEELLQTYLTPLQREMRQKTGFFYVRSMAGEYWILGDGWAAYQCDARGVPLYVRHAAPGTNGYLDQLPNGDRTLAQLLALTTQSGYFERVACRIPIRLIDATYLKPIQSYFGRFIREALETPVPTKPRRQWPQYGGLWGVT